MVTEELREWIGAHGPDDGVWCLSFSAIAELTAIADRIDERHLRHLGAAYEDGLYRGTELCLAEAGMVQSDR